jgi:hypothetical protein
MSVATSTAIGIAGAVGTVGALGGAALQSHAAGKAASAQSQAAEQAAQLQFQLGQENLGFQEQQYLNSLGLMHPYYQSGTAALGALNELMGMPGVEPNTSVFDNPFGASGPPGLPAVSGIGNGTAPLSSLAGSNGGAIGPARSMLMTPPQQPPAGMGGLGGILDVGGANGPPRFSLPPVGPVPSQGPNGPQVPGNPPAGPPPPGTPPSGSPPAIGNTGLPPGFLAQTWNTPFVAPTAEQAEQMPGYKFQLQQGEQAIQNSAAATGGLLNGGTAKALDQYAQGLASTDYNNLFNQALTQYQQSYNIFNQNQANVFNRYADLAGLGQTSAQQLAGAGASAGSNVGNILMGTGSQIGQQLNNAAAATASGYVGSANAYGNALGSIGNFASMLPLYTKLAANQG